MTRQQRIETALQATFDPERLSVINESHLHAGHQPEFDGSGDSHFRVRLQSASFTGKSRIDRHRAVNAALQAEFDGGLHALAVEAAAPGETTRW